MHALEIRVEAHAINEAAAVSGQQYRDAGISIVIESVAQNRGLQSLIHAMFPAVQRLAFRELYLDALVFQAVSQVPKLRRNGSDGSCMLDIAAGVGQLQEIPEINLQAVTGGRAFPLERDIASADKNVGVVPVNKDFFHFKPSASTVCGRDKTFPSGAATVAAVGQHSTHKG